MITRLFIIKNKLFIFLFTAVFSASSFATENEILAKKTIAIPSSGTAVGEFFLPETAIGKTIFLCLKTTTEMRYNFRSGWDEIKIDIPASLFPRLRSTRTFVALKNTPILYDLRPSESANVTLLALSTNEPKPSCPPEFE